MNLELIEKPTLILNPLRAQRNLQRMAAKARRQKVRFRPHFKTHQSTEIGAWFRQEGVQAITVSSVDMARYFAEAGWADILIAFTANWRQIREINDLASRIHLELLVESAETAGFLQEHLTAPVDAWIKVDVGAHRTGIPVQEHGRIRALVAQMSGSRLRFRGLLTHAGQTYHANSPLAIAKIFQQSIESLTQAREALCQAGFTQTELSYGDTPSCSLVEDWAGLTEVRPGNFIFYDMMQRYLGVCAEEDIAVAVACPVVAKHTDGNVQRIVLYGGAVHLSKEYVEVDGAPFYGAVAPLRADGWGAILAGARLTSLSQEHGLVKVTPEQFDQIQIGDLLAVLPVHSCLTVDLHRQYLTTEGQVIRLKVPGERATHPAY
jgi:D-serine deaminase-like pyridoxal phosphate-dependent protein